MTRTTSRLLVLLACTTVARAGSPNIIILYADDMGIGDAGCYGARDIRTPAIDALAARGVRFSNYYSAAPVCSPSRAALLTGRYPIRAGVPTNVPSTPGSPGMPGSEITVAELAKSRGYLTGLIGKWHLGFAPGCEPNDQGFDEFFGHHAGCIDHYSHLYYWPDPGDPPHHDLYRNRREVHEGGQYMTELVAREAVSFIEAQARGPRAVPFLLYVPFNAPHFPMLAPNRFREMYAGLPAQRAVYAAMVSAMDEAIGSIMDALGRAGWTEQTFVFFASDNGATVEPEANHGGGSNGPYRGHKFSVFEGGIHMPAIVCWPGRVPAGVVRDQLVCAIDLLPTLAEAIGVALPADRTIDGRSWLGLLSDGGVPGHDSLCWREGKQYAVRQGRWKLLFRAMDTAPKRLNVEVPSEDRVFLADLQADPGETRNLAQGNPEIVKRLTRLYQGWEQDVTSGR